MGVLLQAFYWDCPRLENQEFKWWSFVNEQLDSIRNAGFTALWLPPAGKAANIGGMSMGYDPYDFYDLGEYDQKGSRATWFGMREELTGLIEKCHEYGLQVYADLVLNHNNGGDEKEINPLDQQERWTRFNPASGKFPRNWECFHPSRFERWDNREFGAMPDLCHRNPYVYSELMEYSRWLIEDIGFDGFRYDFVMGYGGWMVKSILERKYRKPDNENYSPFGVGECWDKERDIDEWLDEVNNWSDNPGTAFDFALREKLKNLCDQFGYSLLNFLAGDTLSDERPVSAVTFVENHDLSRQEPIINDKILAYAWILTHEGYPCVFWTDYFNLGLGASGSPTGIEALVQLHESHAYGRKRVLYVNDDLYIMQREGIGDKPGLIFVLNNRGDSWQGQWVYAGKSRLNYRPAAYYSSIATGQPEDKTTDAWGYADFWAPPRGYAVYVPA